MTNEQIMKLAAEGYKTGKITPCQGSTNCCVLGAATYAKTGELAINKYGINAQGYITELFRRSYCFISGVICGFDGGDKDKEIKAYRGSKKKLQFLDGYKFGRKALKKFLPSKAR